MRRNEAGFTLIELMIVVAIIAIIAAIAIPNLLSARLNANETAAVATLRNISSAQAQFQASSHADVDNDGTGEFGVFGELSSGCNVRGTASTITPSVLSGAFKSVNANGEVSRSGYLFQMYLPGAAGVGVEEDTVGGGFSTPTDVDSDLAETTWCCYAWPANYNNSGNRTFFVNQTGDVTATDDEDYTGANAGSLGGTLDAGSAMMGAIANITGNVAIGTAGADTNIWKQVN